MKDNQDVLLDKRINHLVLPGTHHSAAYQIEYSKLKFWQKIPHNKKSIEKWFITQKYTIREQLNMGIRVLDLNIVCVNGMYWVAYHYICTSLERVLDDIQDFIQTNSSEVILIKLTHAFKMSGSERQTLARLWNESLGAYMYPYKNELPTYGQMIYRRKTLLTFCNYEDCWPLSAFSSIRFAQTDPYAIVKDATHWAEEFHNYYQRVFGLTYALEAKEKYSKSLLHQKYTSLKEANDVLFKAFEEIWSKMCRKYGQINVLLFDFPTRKIIQTMISSNLTST